MNKKFSTSQAKKLIDALRDRGIKIKAEYWDEHKHIDICIPEAKIYIEVDGKHHLTDPKQIMTDFVRDNYSMKDDFDTLHIPNSIIDDSLDEIADAIRDVVIKRILDNKK